MTSARPLLFFALMTLFAGPARADVDLIRQADASPPADAPAQCLFQDLKPGEVCPVYSTARGLGFLRMGEEAILFLERETAAPRPSKASAPALRSAPVRTSVLASSRLEDAVLLEQIDEDDALLLEREVLELSGARYELPRTRSEVKGIVGFPESAEVASEDWVEMVRVHAEITLSLSKNASRFLLEQMGVVGPAPEVTTAAAPTGATPAVAPEFAPGAPLNPAVVETH